MDPNKIHIDELVRQRLRDGEEEPRPGAWITMRELLDGKMPVGRPAGGFGWGRAASWTTGLVLLTLMAGGYGAMEISRESSKPLAETTTARTAGKGDALTTLSNSTTRIAGGQRRTSSMNGGSHAATSSSTSEAASAHFPAAAINRTTSSASASRAGVHLFPTEAGAQKAGSLSPGSTSAASKTLSATVADNSSQASLTPAASTVSVTASSRRERRAPVRSTVQPAPSPSSSRSTSPSIAENPARPKRARRTANALADKTDAVQQGVRPESRPVVASASRATTPRGASSTRRNARGSNRPAPSALDSTKVLVQRDTINTIRIAQRYFPSRGSRAGRYVADTLATEPSIIERRIPESMAALTSTPSEASATARTRRRLFARRSKTALVASPAFASSAPKTTSLSMAASSPMLTPAASQSFASSSIAYETLVPLSSLKVSSTKNSKLQYSAQEQIQDAMRKARFAFGQMRLYTGVTGGFNASVGGTSMGGFHAGLFGLLAINDHWSAGVEGKFVQRFNRGTELHDPYFQYRAANYDQFSTPDGEAYKVYRVTTDSFQHYYKLSTLEAVELPVYARYSFRRFHGFAGANLTFALGVKNMERVERFAGRESNRKDTLLATATYAPPANTAATVSINDFGPRFGLGYTAGLGFQASPSVLMDVRMTQLVWDNRSNTPGDLRVSQTFYRVPSLQLSIGYRFSQQSQRR